MTKQFIEWKDITNFEDAYEISNTGIIRSKDRTSIYYRLATPVNRIIKGKEITGSSCGKKTKDGVQYRQVILCWNGDRRIDSVHRLVVGHFIEKQDNEKCFINHINGNKRDNRASNLEWCTHLENISHSVKNNMHAFGEQLPIAQEN